MCQFEDRPCSDRSKQLDTSTHIAVIVASRGDREAWGVASKLYRTEPRNIPVYVHAFVMPRIQTDEIPSRYERLPAMRTPRMPAVLYPMLTRAVDIARGSVGSAIGSSSAHAMTRHASRYIPRSVNLRGSMTTPQTKINGGTAVASSAGRGDSTPPEFLATMEAISHVVINSASFQGNGREPISEMGRSSGATLCTLAFSVCKLPYAQTNKATTSCGFPHPISINCAAIETRRAMQ